MQTGEQRPNPLRRTIALLTTGPRWLYRKYRAFRVFLTALQKLYRKEREWHVPFRLRQPKWWLKGFLSRSAVLYELERNDPNLYVSDVHRYFRTKNMVHARIQEIINNKLSTHLLLGSMDIPSPELVGVYWRQMIHRFPQEGRVPVQTYLQEMADGDTLFFKVLAGAEGKNIYAVQRTGANTWAINGTDHPVEAAAGVFLTQNRPLIIERGLAQHADQDALYPNSVNTIRVLTMLDVQNGGDPFIAAAVQRIGCRRSEPADNWTRGGLSAQVNLETGQLSKATRLPDENVKEWFSAHPDTGAQIEGVSVPYWREIHDLVMHSAKVLSFMEYVGWDIVVTPKGPVILEANINTGLNVLQSHEPLMADPRVRAYYNERGVRTGLASEPVPPEEAPL